MNSLKFSRKYRVSINYCDSYEDIKINHVLEKTFSDLEISFKRGMKVLIKPNLMSPAKPEKAITTHPVILEEICKILKKSDVEIFIGESSFHKTEIAFDICQIRALGRYGQLVNFEKQPVQMMTFNDTIKEVPLPKILFEVDLIINVAKLKTHSLTGGVSLCVKNLYGCIPGAIKQGYHKLLTTPRSFSKFLVQLHNRIVPQLNIIDGVMGLEGDGPGVSGKPICSNLIIAGNSALAVDIVASEIMGFRVKDIFTNYYSGLCQSDIETVGDGQDVRLDFEKPLSASIPYFQFLSRFIPKSRIDFNLELCTSCGLCRDKCPSFAISLDSFPKCDNRLCVRCYCCMEACPCGAVYLREHYIRSLLRNFAKKMSFIKKY